MADNNFPEQDSSAAIAAALARKAGVTPPLTTPRQGFATLSEQPDAGRQSVQETKQRAGPEAGDTSPESLKPETAESPTERINTYDPLTAAQKDHDVITGLLSSITRLLHEQIASQGALQEQQRLVVEQFLAAVQQQRLLIDELMRNGANQGPGLGYAASTQATVMETEAADAAQRWPSPIWEKVKAEVKRVLARLWSMISKLLTVKEWALSGKVGTPGPLLGLAEASVSVTFGR